MGIGEGTIAWRKNRRAEYVGRRFGRLVVLSVDPKSASGMIKYICECDCGNQTSSYKHNLKIGSAMSCGCLRAEQQRKFTVATANEEYSKHRNHGQKRGLGFLERSVWDSIVYRSCDYCGLIDTRNGLNRHKVRKERAKGLERLWDLEINGIDRIDPMLNYSPTNVVPCCGICNVMKSMLTVEQFEARINAIYNHRKLDEKRGFEELDQGFGPRRFSSIRARSRDNGTA